MGGSNRLAPTARGHAARDLQGEMPHTRGIPRDNAEQPESHQREGGCPKDNCMLTRAHAVGLGAAPTGDMTNKRPLLVKPQKCKRTALKCKGNCE